MGERQTLNGGEAARTNDGNALTGVLGGDAVTGKVMAEVNAARQFGEGQITPIQGFEAANLPNINRAHRYSEQTEAAAAPPPQQDNKEMKNIMGNAAVVGAILDSDRKFSPAALMAADEKIRKATAA